MTDGEPGDAILSIVTAGDGDEHGQKGLLSKAGGSVNRVAEVSADALRSNLDRLRRTLLPVLADQGPWDGDVELDQIEVLIEITAKGEVRLIGAASTEVKGGVKLVFRKAR